LNIPAGGSRRPASHATIDERQHYVHMEGSRVFRNAVRAMAGGLVQAMAEAEVDEDGIDMFIPHQANIRIMEACRERTNIDAGKVFSVLEKYGNISAASIPVAMAEAREIGRLRDGDILAMTAFGTGLTWGAAVLKF
jgi:3-oxoacyl-[acyl-carrier-protein] synthase III